MYKRLLAIGAALLIGSPLVGAAPAQEALVLNDQTFQKWHDFIAPRPFELEWTQVPWRPSFWEGVVEGQEKDRPLLLWIMNGHPLSET